MRLLATYPPYSAKTPPNAGPMTGWKKVNGSNDDPVPCVGEEHNGRGGR
ncbi:hypothetical protein ARZXY2_4963 (plasmid) [Arthrobacter sp. ZXY-2]|nr:hypothetical protein ARZXY2_4963 [Arthrobacter sp. ZXY-2]